MRIDNTIIKKIYSKDKKVLIDNFLSLGMIKFFDLFIPLLVVPILISKVGITNYGKYAFAFAFIFYFLNIAQYGFSLSAVREISINKSNRSEVNKSFNDVFTTKLFLTILILIVILIIVFSVPFFFIDYKLYFFLSLIIVGDTLSPVWFFQGIENMRFITIVNLVAKLSFILFVLLFIKNEKDYYLIGLCHSSGYIISGVLSLYFAVKKFGIKIKISSLKSVSLQIKLGFSNFLTMITPLLYANTSIFLTGFYGAPSSVSYIEIGTKVSGAFGSLNGILTQVFYPLVNRKRETMKRVRIIIIWCGVLASIAMLLTSEWLISIWLRHIDQKEIIHVVKILSLSPFLLALSSAYGVNGLLVLKKDNLYLNIIKISSLFGLFFAISLIPEFSYIGAALAILIARTLIGAGSLYFFKNLKFNHSNPNLI